MAYILNPLQAQSEVAVRFKFLILLFFLCLSSLLQAQTLVVSDIDDTLRLIHRRSWDMLEQVNNATDNNKIFSGMKKILYSLNANGDKIHYVTAAPEVLAGFGWSFLNYQVLPQRENYHYRSLLDGMATYKTQTILGLIAQLRPQKVILIGDNGEKDSVAYAEVQRQLVARKSPVRVYAYLHKLYGQNSFTDVPSTQNLYLTGADLAVQLQAEGLITSAQAQSILLDIQSEIQRPHAEYGRERIWPQWGERTKTDFQRILQKIQTADQSLKQQLIQIWRGLGF
jgi:hypothetical protein